MMHLKTAFLRLHNKLKTENMLYQLLRSSTKKQLLKQSTRGIRVVTVTSQNGQVATQRKDESQLIPISSEKIMVIAVTNNTSTSKNERDSVLEID